VWRTTDDRGGVGEGGVGEGLAVVVAVHFEAKP
jgi:hypothetical protein